MLQSLDDLRGGAGADVGVDQRLLEPLPGLVVEVAEEAWRGAQASAPRASCAGSRAGGERSRGAAARARPPRPGGGAPLFVDEEVVPVAGHGSGGEYERWSSSAPSPPAAPTARALLTAMEQEMFELITRCPGGCRAGRPAPKDLEPPAGGSVPRWGRTGSRSRAAAWCAMGPGVAEIKRMYVVPEARRRGHARRLLKALEDGARALGYERVRLDTGARQPHARALYASAGFTPIPDYNREPEGRVLGREGP